MSTRRHRLRSFAVATFLLLPGCASVLTATRDDDRTTLARLLRNGKDPNEETENGVTPLMVAIESGNFQAAKLLLEGGADPNKLGRCRSFKVTPVQKAAVHGDLVMVRLLLEKGADPTLPGEPHDVFSLMAIEKDKRDTAAIVDALVKNVEAKKGHDAVKSFLDARSPYKWTPLTAAAHFGDVDLVTALVEHGASVDVLAPGWFDNERVSDEWAPIHFAIVKGNSTIIDVLVAHGADRLQKSRAGKTPSELLSDLESRRAEAEAERARARREQEEEQAKNAAMFQGMMNALQKGAEAGMEQSRRDREAAQRQVDQAAEYDRQRKEQREREAQEAREEQRREQQDARRSSSAPSNQSSTATNTSSITAPLAGTRSNREEDAKKQRAEEDRRRDDARRKDERERQEKADREAREKQEKAVAAEAARRDAEQARRDALTTFRNGIRLRATKCPDGEGNYYVIGTRPSTKQGSACINVAYRATCATNRGPSTGVLRNFVGGGSCFGDSQRIDPKPSCDVKDVTVLVDDVTYCD
jgi:ankyrin repeat protein